MLIRISFSGSDRGDPVLTLGGVLEVDASRDRGDRDFSLRWLLLGDNDDPFEEGESCIISF